MSELSDEILMAYADGELLGVERARVEKSVASDPALRARVAAFEATRDALQKAFAPVLAADVPERLLQAIRGTPMPATYSGVSRARSLTRNIAEATGASFWQRLRPGMVLATTLAVGVGIGVVGHRASVERGVRIASGAEVMSVVDGRLRASGALARVLERAPSGNVVAEAGANGQQLRITPVLTFRSRSQEFCRQYELRAGEAAAFAGFACRAPSGEWTIQVHTPMTIAGGASGAYKPASRDASPALEAAISSVMAGDALMESTEAKARAAGWK